MLYRTPFILVVAVLSSSLMAQTPKNWKWKDRESHMVISYWFLGQEPDSSSLEGVAKGLAAIDPDVLVIGGPHSGDWAESLARESNEQKTVYGLRVCEDDSAPLSAAVFKMRRVFTREPVSIFRGPANAFPTACLFRMRVDQFDFHLIAMEGEDVSPGHEAVRRSRMAEIERRVARISKERENDIILMGRLKAADYWSGEIPSETLMFLTDSELTDADFTRISDPREVADFLAISAGSRREYLRGSLHIPMIAESFGGIENFGSQVAGSLPLVAGFRTLRDDD